MARDPGDLPSNGPPGGILEKKDSSGGIIQRRYYDSTGKAEKNIDWGHDHLGCGDPHAHDWDWSRVPARQPARPLKPGE